MIIQTNSFNLIVLLIYDFEFEIILCEGILMQNAGEIRLLYFQKDDYRAYISLWMLCIHCKYIDRIF